MHKSLTIFSVVFILVCFLQAAPQVTGTISSTTNIDGYFNRSSSYIQIEIRLTAENLLTPMGIENYLLEEKDDKKRKVLTKEIKKRREFIRNILDSNRQMDSLVSRLLALSRIERRDKLTNTEKLKIFYRKDQ